MIKTAKRCSICRYVFDRSKSKHRGVCNRCFKKCNPDGSWKHHPLKKLLKGWKTKGRKTQ
jgi:hypothetical protein